MKLHLYALVESPARLPPVEGIGGSGVRSSRANGIEAIVGEVGGTDAPPTAEAIAAHAAVVDEVAKLNDAVLPVRFGAPFENEADVTRTVVAREIPIRKAMERVRGAVEFGLRVFADVAAVAGPQTSGRDYMLTRLRTLRDAERLAAEIHDPLAATARATTHQVLPSPGVVLHSTYLVSRTDVEHFRAEIRRLEHTSHETRFVCTGPWPPYTFAILDPKSA